MPLADGASHKSPRRPHTDLFVSPGHAMLFGEVLANGAWAETSFEDRNRSAFHNAALPPRAGTLTVQGWLPGADEQRQAA